MYRILLTIGILFTLHSQAWAAEAEFNIERNFENTYNYYYSLNETIRIIEKEDISKPENRDFVLGTMYGFALDIDKSKQLYKEAIKNNESHYFSHLALGYIYYAEGQKEKAIEHFEKAIKIAPDKAVIYNTLGYFYLAEERYDEANDILEKGISILDDDESLLINQSMILLQPYFEGQREQEKIVRDMTRVLETSKNADDYLILGAYYLKIENTEEARDVLERGLELEPENVLLILAYGATYTKDDDYEKALEIAHKASDLEPENKTVLKAIEDIREEYKEWKEENEGK